MRRRRGGQSKAFDLPQHDGGQSIDQVLSLLPGGQRGVAPDAAGRVRARGVSLPGEGTAPRGELPDRLFHVDSRTIDVEHHRGLELVGVTTLWPPLPSRCEPIHFASVVQRSQQDSITRENLGGRADRLHSAETDRDGVEAPRAGTCEPPRDLDRHVASRVEHECGGPRVVRGCRREMVRHRRNDHDRRDGRQPRGEMFREEQVGVEWKMRPVLLQGGRDRNHDHALGAERAFGIDPGALTEPYAGWRRDLTARHHHSQDEPGDR